MSAQAAAAPRLPELDADNRAFWTSGAQGQLKMCYCAHCSHFIHPPSAACSVCAGTDLDYRAVSGRGQVVSYSVNYQPWLPQQAVPFVLATVELQEQKGLWLISNIVGCEPEQVAIGLDVQVCFEPHDDVWLPLFEPRELV